MADQPASSVPHVFRTRSKVQVIQKNPFLTSPAFLPVQPKRNRHKTTGYLGLCHNTQACPYSLKDLLGELCQSRELCLYVKTTDINILQPHFSGSVMLPSL